jgi:hypothetical protein
MINYPNIRPYDAISPSINAINAAGGITQNQTALLQLEDIRRQQAEDAALRQYFQANPDALLQPGGGMPQSTIGSLQQPPGAIQQSPMPGMPGQAQTVPAPQDLSQFATGQPPPSTLGGLAQPTRPDPMRAFMQQHPGAALRAMDLQQKAQDRQWKQQETLLGIQEKKLAHWGQLLQGATDQASWDRAREEIGRIDQRAAASLPPMFSKEAREQVVQQAMSVKDRTTLGLNELKTRAEIRRLGLQGRPDIINTYLEAQGVDPATATPEQVSKAIAGKNLDEITTEVEKYRRLAPYKLEEARQTGAAQAGEQPLSDTTATTVTALRRGESLAHQLLTEFTPEERAKFVGLGGLRMSGQQLQAWLRDATKTGADPRYARFLTLLNEAKNEAFATGGKALSQQEAEVVFGYIPTGKETSVEQFEQKLQQAKDRSTTRLDETLKLATTPKRALAGERESGSLARPGSGAAPRGTTTGSKGTVTLETLGQYVDKYNAANPEKKMTLGQAIRKAYDQGLEIQ